MKELPEALITFVQVLSEDDELRAWFRSFADTAPAQRAVEFRQLASRMQAAAEPPELVQATAMLADERVYVAAEHALQVALGEA